MDILERESQLSMLEEALSEAKSRRGCLALVSGEAGIGKTALVEAFTRRHRNTVRVLWGGSDALFTPRPLGPLHDMASKMAGELPELLASDAQRNAVFSAVLNEFQRQPAIVVFEDIHWADEATLDLLRFVARRIGQTSALLVLTYRDDELSPRHPLRSLLGDLSSSAVTRRIALPPLSEKAVQELVGEQAVDVAALHRQTGGNPFYVTEVLANSGSGIPATVRDAVMARCARLSVSAYVVLEAAATIGQRVEPWLLSQVTGAEAHAAEECMAVGMLLAQNDELAFRHELARRTILEMTSPLRRQVLHRLILDSLKSSPATRNNLARLAHHAEGAGDRKSILAYAPAAARQASLSGAHRAAATLYELTLQHANELPIAERAELLRDYAVECDVIDQRPAAISANRQAAELWKNAGNKLKYANTLGRLALLLHLVGDGEEAEQVNDAAIRILEELPPSQDLAHVYNSQAILYLARLENRKGVDLAEKAIAIIDRMPKKTLLPRLYETLGLCWLHLDYEKGIALLERSLESGIEFGQSMRTANSYANLSSVYIEFHQFERAEACLAKGLAFAAEQDLAFARMYMLAWQAQLYLHRGRWSEAGLAAGEVLQDPATSIGSRSPALTVVGRLRARRGDPGADTALDESLELLFQLGFRQREGLVRAARAEEAWLAGDSERTLAEAKSVYNRALDQKHPWGAGELAFWQWRAGGTPDLPGWIASPYALQISGDWWAAAEAWRYMGCPYERARALADGDPEAQKVALEIFERLAARPDADRLRQKMQADGVSAIPPRPHTSTRENPFGLTNRQIDVLALLMEGFSNAEIAGRLHISPKTAEHHVSAILARLDVHTRDEAASLARQHPTFRK